MNANNDWSPQSVYNRYNSAPDGMLLELMAYDIRNRLESVSAYVSLLEEDFEYPEGMDFTQAKEYLQNIFDGLDAIGAVVTAGLECNQT
jgi:hypothetical protein